MDPEDNIPICDVFAGDEAFWTELYTGPSASYIRASYNLSKESEESKLLKCRITLANRTQEEIDSTYEAKSVASKRVWKEQRDKIIETQNAGKRSRPPEAVESMKKQMSESAIAVWEGYTFDQKNTRVSNQYRRSEGPNSPELFLGLYLLKRSPGEWALNGQCQLGVVIGGKVPDVINLRGKKVVIEVFGAFFHQEEEESLRIEHFRTYGYECVVFWEFDCYLEEELDKILEKVGS